MGIEARNLSKSYGGKVAVDGISLSIKKSCIFGFLGPNGAGKSTTIKMLTTFLRPTSGDLWVLGIDAAKDPLGIRKRIGVVLQQPSYEQNLTVERSIDTYGMMWGVPKGTRKERLEGLLRDFGLENIRKVRNEDLSIGQRRRVQIAREFIHEMDLLFLDEPTVGLDTVARRRMLDLLKEKARSGLTIFYTTHVLSEAEYICDEIAIIDRGRILTTDTTDNLKKRYASQKTVRVVLTERRTGVDGLLAEFPECTVHHDETTRIVIRSDNPAQVLVRLIEKLGGSGAEISEITAAPPSLEEVFLSVTGH